MRKFLFGAFAFTVASLLSMSAQAGSLSSHLSFDGVNDVLDDDSVSLIVDRDGDLAISTGDIVFGVLRIGTTTANGILSPTDQLIGVFSFEVATSTGVAGADPTIVLTHKGVDPLDGTGFSIDEILAASGIAAPSHGASSVVAVLSSDPNPTDITTVSPGVGLAGITAALSAYSLDAILGFGSGTDFLDVKSFSDTNDNGKIDFSELPAPGSGGFIASETGGLSVLSHTMGGGVVFLPVTAFRADGSSVTADVKLDGTLFASRSATPAGWSVVDSTVLEVNAVPEPSSMILLGMGLAGMGGFGYRRRKTKKAAA